MFDRPQFSDNIFSFERRDGGLDEAGAIPGGLFDRPDLGKVMLASVEGPTGPKHLHTVGSTRRTLAPVSDVCLPFPPEAVPAGGGARQPKRHLAGVATVGVEAMWARRASVSAPRDG